jgi:hypothetical protein
LGYGIKCLAACCGVLLLRVEIATALRLDKTVIPVLVNGATMPKPAELPEDIRKLTEKKAAPVRDDPDFHHDITDLIARLISLDVNAKVEAPPHPEFLIHIDYFPETEELTIKYSYPFSETHQLPEQTILLSKDEIPSDIHNRVKSLLQALSDRIPPPTPVVFPGKTIMPSIRRTGATIVIQDYGRTLPIARQYYLEEIKNISRQEKQVRMEQERSDYSSEQLAVFAQLQECIRAIVWDHYKELLEEEDS